jgi:hypothetical protein
VFARTAHNQFIQRHVGFTSPIPGPNVCSHNLSLYVIDPQNAIIIMLKISSGRLVTSSKIVTRTPPTSMQIDYYEGKRDEAQ